MKKLRDYGGRLLGFFLSILALSLLVFILSRLASVDPLQAYYGERVEKMSVREKEEARERLGLADPIPVQYLRWLNNALKGDFGISFQYKQKVTEVIGAHMGNTLVLGGLGFLLIFLGAPALGLACVRHEDSLLDRLLCRLGTWTSCIPEFLLSLALILAFGVTLKWLPSGGAYSVGREGGLVDRLRHLVLPLTVALTGHLWYYAYMVRNRLAEEMRAGYVLLGKAKGLTGGQVLWRHCLRNILPSYLSIMAASVPHILGGAYLVETVFSYPGIGTLSYESVRYGDYNMLMALCLMTGITVMSCNFLSRIVNERLDPRLRAEEAGKTAEGREG